MNRNLLLIAVSLLTWGLGESMFINLHPLYLKELSAQPVMIGAIYSAMGFVMSLAHIPAGYLADRFGQRPLIWLAWIIGLAAAWMMALAPSLITFIIGLLIYSLTAFVMSPLNSYITAARGRLEVGRALTLISAFYSVGAIFGPFTGGWLATTFGLRQVYITAACIFLLSTVIIAFLRTAPNEPTSIEKRRDGSRFTRTFVVYLGIVFLVMPLIHICIHRIEVSATFRHSPWSVWIVSSVWVTDTNENLVIVGRKVLPDIDRAHLHFGQLVQGYANPIVLTTTGGINSLLTLRAGRECNSLDSIAIVLLIISSRATPYNHVAIVNEVPDLIGGTLPEFRDDTPQIRSSDAPKVVVATQDDVQCGGAHQSR